jgi:hypothetical protein
VDNAIKDYEKQSVRRVYHYVPDCRAFFVGKISNKISVYRTFLFNNRPYRLLHFYPMVSFSGFNF